MNCRFVKILHRNCLYLQQWNSRGLNLWELTSQSETFHFCGLELNYQRIIVEVRYVSQAPDRKWI